MSNPGLRRSVVAASIVASLFVAAFTIRLAASWTGPAPLADRPPDTNQLLAQLQAQQARAADLTAQLEEVSAQSSELRTALDAARQKASTDATAAEQLTLQLEQARDRLRALQAQLATTPQRTVTVTAPTAQAATGTTSGDHDDDDHDGEHDGGDGDD